MDSVGEGRPSGELEDETNESSRDLEWTMVTRRGGASAKESAAKKHGIDHGTEPAYKSTYKEPEQSNEHSEKYETHRGAHTLKIIPS
jgi:hypothetical protein